MKIRFLGAAREVTGSMIRLDTEAGSLLIDCGFFQGRRTESRQRNRELPPEAVAADVAILTHAHIDHSGSLPTLVRAGFKGTIYATPATRDLCAYMLRDSANIQKADADYLNRKLADEPGFVPIEPLYDEDDVIRALERFVTMPYRHAWSPLPGVTARFLNAGHILGSAELILDVTEGGERRRLVFSGDLGRKNLPVVCDPELPEPPIDYAIMESTYGDRLHGEASQMEADLERVVREALARGGKIIVPAFAVGRTQELLFTLHTLRRKGRLPALPMFVDSPLASAVTGVFRLHPECFDAEARELLNQHGEVFAFEGVRFTESREESMALNELQGPALIIAASGMCEAGRVLHHLRNHIEDSRNTILIVGFMAQHTLGRRIAERHPRVRILGVERALNARVEILDAFSAHADRDDLLRWAAACGPVRRFFLVHGEPTQQEPLGRALAERGVAVTIPSRGDALVLG